jgi:N-acetylneuraminic acid mutarotase
VEWNTLDRGLTNSNQNINTPKPRFKHLAAIYNRALYIYGGTTIPMNEAFDDSLDLYRYNIDESAGSKWEKQKIKCSNKDLDVVSGHCGVLNGNRWFMFGGTNNDFKCNNLLWRLNLDTL